MDQQNKMVQKLTHIYDRQVIDFQQSTEVSQRWVFQNVVLEPLATQKNKSEPFIEPFIWTFTS